MQIDSRLLQVAMTEQDLDRAQVRAGFKQMRSEAVAQQVGMNSFVDAGPLGCDAASLIGDIEADRRSAGVPRPSRKQPLFGFAIQAPQMFAQDEQQLRGEHHVTVFAGLAAADVNDHATRVDVTDLEPDQLFAAHPGSVKRHQNGALEQAVGGVDQPCDFSLAENLRQSDGPLGIGRQLDVPAALERLDVKETQGGEPLRYRIGREPALANLAPDPG